MTGLWNYAQHFAMSDNVYGTTYGPSTPGALNVTAAQTYGATCGPTSATINDSLCAHPAGLNTTTPHSSNITAGSAVAAGPGTTYSDADPTYDICSYLPSADGGDGDTPAQTLTMGGNNIGDELTTPTSPGAGSRAASTTDTSPGTAPRPPRRRSARRAHKNVGGASQVTDYIPHHEPFEYYASTANPMHKPPTSVAMIGHTDQANHQYDTADFLAAADAGNLPAVSYLKAPEYQDGHAGYSDPLDEQTWLADTINHLESLPTWKSTAVVITWDDSDGWYDHMLAPIITESQTSLDALTGTGQCGSMLSQVPVELGRAARAGQVRPRPAAAVPGHLAVGEVELRGQHPHRPELGGEVHRVQLAPPGAGQRRGRRPRPGRSCRCSTSRRSPDEPGAVPQPGHRRAGEQGVGRSAPQRLTSSRE